VGDDLAKAGSLLREIATELAALPLDERSAPLHQKLLALRRVVSDWARQPPPAALLEAALDSLRSLQAQVGELRAVSGPRLRSTDAASLRKIRGR
jgi:hypothetical protein